LYDRLARLRPGAELVLVHSRFRPGDRQRAIDRALGPPGGHGTIVVTTQVLEAGVDVSSSMLYTETAPWPSVVQRAGRCNRDGLEPAPTLLWAPAPKAPPYEQADLDATAAALTDLEGRVITPATLGQLDVATVPAVHPILRRRDLIGLFDTAPDLSGNDIDIGRFIREADDLDAHVAWRALGKAGPEADEPGPTASELCPVPLQELREYLASRSGWFVDHLSAKAWARLGRADVRPGLVAILDATQGGYDPDRGWDPRSTARVPPLLERDEPSPLAGGEEPTGADPLSATVRRPSLLDHLREAEQAATNLASQLDPPGLSAEACSAAIAAASLHDVGKAHPVFQESLRKAAGLDPEKGDGQLWAKSGTRGRLIHSRRHFRHELASALALLGDGSVVLDGLAEPDLATYLVAAHHGVVRLGIRSLPGDDSARCPNAGGRVALGVCDGDRLPDVVTPRGTVPGLTLDLAAMELGDSPDGRPSWAARVLALRDRPDLGPFRLGFLEALVVLADWRVSSDDFVPATPGGPA
ncbi:MAG: HD domain-containing protein, partial [Acidimicrobiales bacterium]